MNNLEILERVRKLLALAENNINVGEAANAAAKASELLHAHNLSIEDVPVERQPIDEYGKQDVDYDGQSMWRRILLQAIAKSNNASTAYRAGGTTGSIVGRAHECEVTIWMYGYLCREFTRIAKIEYQAYKDYALKGSRSWYNSFYLGAVGSVVKRLEELARERMAEPGSRALVLNRASLLRRASARLLPNARSTKTTVSNSDGNAYLRGRKAGSEVSLGRPVTGGAGRLALAGR